eukprot:3704133-Lingulodinium_polyedra.AAC.1
MVRPSELIIPRTAKGNSAGPSPVRAGGRRPHGLIAGEPAAFRACLPWLLLAGHRATPRRGTRRRQPPAVGPCRAPAA